MALWPYFNKKYRETRFMCLCDMHETKQKSEFIIICSTERNKVFLLNQDLLKKTRLNANLR